MATTPDKNEVNNVLNDTPASTAVATRTPTGIGSFEDVSGGAMELPGLKISFGDSIGTLTGFNAGELVLDKTDRIAGKGEKLQVVVLNARTYWKEFLPFGTPMELIRTFDTVEQVHAAGGTTNQSPNKGWSTDPATGKSKGPGFREAVTIDLLIKKPKDLISSMFCIPYGDDMYAPCRYYADKDNAESLLTELRRAKYSLAKRGLVSGGFDLWTLIKIFKNGNKTWISALKLSSHADDAFVKFVTETLAGKELTEKTPDPDAGVGEELD